MGCLSPGSGSHRARPGPGGETRTRLPGGRHPRHRERPPLLINRLYLRNYRVFEDELELELPPGLVGIFGPNGAGKSTLLEAILWTLWGKARTTRELIRTSGVGGDCVTEVEFEHEGHLYLVRRVLKGVNSTVTVEAHCD